MVFILTQDVRIGDNGLVIHIRGGTIGNEAGIAIGITGQAADLMGDDLAKTVGILGNEGNDVALLQCFGRYFLDEDQVAGIEVRGSHGVRLYNVCTIAKQITVVSIKSRYRDDRKNHHGYCQRHDQPYEYCFQHIEYTFKLHIYTSFSAHPLHSR